MEKKIELLNTKPVTELVSEAVIRVCYVSDEPNRNDSIISEAAGRTLAETLPAAPVVGHFNKTTADFGGHDYLLDDDGNLEPLTVPLGFVDPMSLPWYETFEELTDEGETVARKYLCAKAFLWTDQYAAAKQVFEAGGKGQSMELFDSSMEGHWTENFEYFVFTSARIKNLTILGDEHEPCFEMARVTPLQFNMLNELATEVMKYETRPFKFEQAIKDGKTHFAHALGYNLEQEVMTSLDRNGFSYGNYTLEGLYEENGQKFAIITNNANGELVKAPFTIVDDKVELTLEFITVRVAFIPVSASEALTAEEAKAVIEAQTVVATTVGTTSTLNKFEDEAVETAEVAEGEVAEVVEGEVEEEAAEPIEEESPLIVEELITEDSFAVDAVSEVVDAIEEAIEQTPDTEILGGDPDIQAEGDFESEEEDAELKEKYNLALAELEELKAYKVEKEQAAKQEVVDSFSLLTTEEKKPVIDQIATLTFAEVEKELALIFTKKSLEIKKAEDEVKEPAAAFGVNVSAVENSAPELPSWFVEAQKHEKPILEFKIA